VTLYHEPNAKLPPSHFGGVAKVHEVTASGFPQHPLMSVFEDELGRIWVLATGGVGYLQNERFIRLPAIPGGEAFSISGDTKGNLWISNWDHGLLHIRDESLVEQVPWTTMGGKGIASALVADLLHGGVWLGFGGNGGLAHFDSGHLSTSYTATEGLGQGRVNDLRIDPDGTLWAATAGGLSRVKNNRIATLSSANGLPCEMVHWSIEDNDHDLWLYMPCGLVRIAHSELEAWKNDRSYRIQTTLFGASDGVWTHGFSGHGMGPGVAKSPDGRLWFTSPQGLSVIDPHHLAFNRLPPPVDIEQITVDQKTYETNLTSNVSMRLPAQVRDLRIDYTALSFVAPEKVRFRYKLQGWDREWQDAGTRRQAFYSNLPPRDYRFRVTASNNSGVWNEQGAALDFSIAPAYWQTNWFRALCFAAFLLLLWAIYWLRLRDVTRTFNMTLEARVNERTRIARELHDTLLQSLHGLMFQFQAVRNLLPRRPDEAIRSLDRAINDTEKALAESRDAIQGLRSEPLAKGNLAELLMAASRELAKSGTADQQSPAFELIEEGEKRALSSVAKNEVCRVALEVLRNAYRHAHATRIEAEIRYDDRVLRVRIRDNGRGIDSNVLKDGGFAGHWGLRGVRERAERIGARIDFWSEAGAGTEVQLTVPADVAYETAHDDARSRLLRKVRSRAELS
jgi:signal transduction histidine kinase/streptogramin lyase